MERYYYDHQHRLKRNGRNDKGKFHYFFPFLVFIGIGIVLALGFKLLTFFFADASKEMTVMYIAKGGAQLKIWGGTDFTTAYNGTRILQGDEISTFRDSQVVVRFFDGSYMRLNGDTHVVFDEIKDDGSSSKIKVIVDQGEVWINETLFSASDTDFYVVGNYVEVNPDGDVVDFENKDGVETVRVVLGSSSVDVYSQNKGVKVDNFNVVENKMAVIGTDKLERFWKFQSPNVIEELDVAFKGGVWYSWNIAEDEVPTVVTEPEVSTAAPAEPTDAPTILTIGGQKWNASDIDTGLTVTNLPVKVTGTVSGAEKVSVNNYFLQKFVPGLGEESFTYWLDIKNGNLKEGANTYEVYALGPNGEKSSSVYFKVNYEAPKTAD